MKKWLLLAAALALACGLSPARDLETMKKRIPLGKEEAVQVKMEMALVELFIEAGKSGDIMTADVSYDADLVRPIIDYSPGRVGLLRIETKKRRDLESLKDIENNWNLTFTDKIPLEFSIEVGLGDCEFNFSDLKITDMDIESGLAEMKIIFKRPNREDLRRFKIESGLGELVAEGLLNANFEEFSFSGGLGSSELYFTGKNRRPCEAKIEVGLGSVEIYIERGVPVRINSESSFLASVNVEGMKKLRKGVYISRDWDEKAANRLELYLEVGLGSINVDWY